MSLAEEVGLGRIVLGRKVPAIGAAEDEAPFFKGLQRLTESGVVDAKQSTERSPGNRLRGTTQLAAYCFGKRLLLCNIIAVDEEPERFVMA